MIQYEFTRFLITGGINTLFYYMLFGGCVYLNMDYRVAVLLATAVGIVFSFMTFSKYVFNNRNKKLIFRFIMNYVVVYFLNIYIIGFLHNHWNMNLYLAGFIAMLICAILTYILHKFFVFGQIKILRNSTEDTFT